MTPRRLEASDEDRVQRFLARVPEGDRTFFKEDLAEISVAGWLRDPRAHRALVTDDGGEVRAYAAVIAGVEWSSHVGELRLVVDPGSRGQGMGRLMARWGLVEAVQMGLSKLVVELIADQAPAIAMFNDLGFEGEALLKDHVRDRSGELRDLILLAHHVDGNAASLATTGLEEV
ncbi:MAG TPA: GNAT family N-acetyltransferase [Candidatus Dormibacteraeota bacterium]|nr:GNAT family N-acetyltransferase [Candidatus Dormibacteraeota bacterium]